MVVKKALDIANDIRRVEYAIAEIESDQTKSDLFMSSDELLRFWQGVDDLETRRVLVETLFDALSKKKFSDLKTDVQP